jgi:simple sugar transport system ATP-binding protein
MENITRRFPGVVANSRVYLAVQKGAFHAIIGENGAGKSTLLNILYGRYRPDAGRIFVRGEEVTDKLHSPADAIKRGLGLVSQHYALIPALTVLENVMLGAEPTWPGGMLNRRQAAEKIRDLADKLGLKELDLNARAERLSIAAQQKVEILKALYRGADILLLDEPTATLAPQEADALFDLLRVLSFEGATILFVTHKLREVMTYSHAITVLRRGRNAGDFITAYTNENELLMRMIGVRTAQPMQPRAPLTGTFEPYLPTGPNDAPIPTPIYAPRPVPGSPLLQVEHVTVRNTRRAKAVEDVSISVGMGEIVGVAGVDGSGQRELAEAIIGLRRMETGRLFLAGIELTRRSVRQRQRMGIRYIPEDRHRDGMILDFTVGENYLLGHHRDPNWGGGLLLNRATIIARAAAMIQRYDVRSAYEGATLSARTLSGGNQQKVVVARAMDSQPRLLIACQPTRGLDVEASRFVYRVLRGAREEGMGILLFSLDLDEILELSDRIAVMFNGRISGILSRGQATPQAIGALITGAGVEPTEPPRAPRAESDTIVSPSEQPEGDGE